MGDVTLLIGGVRSGKSALAVEIGKRHDGDVLFMATAEPFDDDMRSRIARHRHDRPDWPTIEVPLGLGAAIAAAPGRRVVDRRLPHRVGRQRAAPRRAASMPTLSPSALTDRRGPSVVITNEVGLGVHPETELGRTYRDELGRVNQAVASVAADHAAHGRRRGTAARRPVEGAHMTWLAEALATMPHGDAAAGDAVRARAAEILRPAGALARLDEVAAWVAEWQGTASPAVRKPGRLDLRRRSRRRRGRGQQVPDRRHGGDARRLPRRQVDHQRLRRDRRCDRVGHRRRRRPPDRRHPHRTGDVTRAVRRGVHRWSRRRGIPRRRSPRSRRDGDRQHNRRGRRGRGDQRRRRRTHGSAAAPVSTTKDWPASVTPCERPSSASPESAIRWRCCARSAAPSSSPSPPRSSRRASRGLPVLLDGYVVTASALPLARSIIGRPRPLPGRALLGRARPPRACWSNSASSRSSICEMRLGEGSGAMAAVPLVAMACAGVTEVPTFGEWFG